MIGFWSLENKLASQKPACCDNTHHSIQKPPKNLVYEGFDASKTEYLIVLDAREVFLDYREA